MSENWRAERVAHIRGLIEQAAPGVIEEVKWVKPTNPAGVPTFTLDGLICTVETYANKVKVTFAKGAALPDPHSVFNASLTAGTRRAVDLFESDVLNDAAFAELISAAVALNRA